MPIFRELLKQELQKDEKVRKEALHSLIERWKLSLELGRKLKGQVGDKNLTPTSRHTPYPLYSRYEFQTSSKSKDFNSLSRIEE